MQLLLFLVVAFILSLVFGKKMDNKGRVFGIAVIVIMSILIYNKYGGF